MSIVEPLLLQWLLVPTSMGESAPVVTYTLGQSVQANSALLFFYKKILVCNFLPKGSTPQWEDEVVSTLYVLQTRVLVACILLRDARRIFY